MKDGPDTVRLAALVGNLGCALPAEMIETGRTSRDANSRSVHLRPIDQRAFDQLFLPDPAVW